MPQFDIFSFFSQSFWVFSCFTFLYLSFTYYVLPMVAITLKVRKRKLVYSSEKNSNEKHALKLFFDTFSPNYSKVVNRVLFNPSSSLLFQLLPKLGFSIRFCVSNFTIRFFYFVFNVSFLTR